MRTIITFSLLLPLLLNAQSISLDSCISAAKSNWPTFKKEHSIMEQRELIDQTLNRNYIPKVTVSGQATYQSEVITFPDISLPGGPSVFPELPLDNYNFEASLNQIIWDGGVIKANKEIQTASNDVQLRSLDVEIYDLIGKINLLYLNYLFLEQNEKILILSSQELDSNLRSIQVGIDNGVLLASDKDHLLAEKIRLQKQLLGINSSKQYILKTINIITGLELSSAYSFENPEVKGKSEMVRPELKLLDAQINLTSTSASRFKTNPIPKFMAFGKVGFGRPGFDPLNTKMHGYYMVGAKFQWDIWGWNSLKKQKEQIEVKKNIISENKEMLTKKIQIEQAQYLSEIDQFEQQIGLAEQIELLTENVYKTAESKFNNGTITSTEFLKVFNELKRARLSTELDRLNLLKSKINYEYAQGVDK